MPVRPNLMMRFVLLALLICPPPPAQAANASACNANTTCMFCPALDDPDSYGQNDMKLLRRIVPGKDQWLFRSEVDFSTDFGLSEHTRGEFVRLVHALEQRGTKLVMAVQPTRGLMHWDKLRAAEAEKFDYQKARDNLRNFLDQMRQAGAIVPEVTRLLDNPPEAEYFFRRDHHWTPAGAEATARLVAEAVRTDPVHANLSKRRFYTEPAATVFKDGTLNVGLRRLCGNNFSMQFLRGYRTVPDDDDARTLFGEAAAADVVLVGTSNSAARESESRLFNFDGYLKQYLQTDVLNYALPGSGEDGALLDYLLSDDYSPQNAPQLIIWELPANYRLDDPASYRQLIPAINGGCQGSALLQQHLALPRMSAGERIEVLSNSGPQRLQLTGMQGLIDLRISDRNLKNFYLILYYDDGSRDKVWYRREAIVRGGQFYLELSREREFMNANLMSVFIEPTQDLQSPVTVESRLCR